MISALFITCPKGIENLLQEEIESLDALLIPGGESTTISRF